MKQKAITIEGVRFEPNWLKGYTGVVNGKQITVSQNAARDWIVRKSIYGIGGRAIGGGSTLRAAVRMAKERV